MKHKMILVFAELENGRIHKISYELLAKGRELCGKINAQLACLVLGSGDMDLSELCYRQADSVYYIKDSCFLYPEECLYKENIVGFIEAYRPEIVLIGATGFGRSLAPRIAAALKTGLTADCTDLRIDEDGSLIQVRPAFSNNILAHIKTAARPQLATVRYKEFAEAQRDDGRTVSVFRLAPYATGREGTAVAEVFKEESFDITEAAVVVAGGRGIRRKEDLDMLRELAGLLGGVLGASRALVDAGMIGSAFQVGYSGNRVKPKVYIACGISGAPQHIAGMKDAALIIAVNSDPSAPIFNIADYGIVGNLYNVIPGMIQAIRENKQ